MLPTQQRLNTNDAPASQRDLGLVVQLELIEFKRTAQEIFQLQRPIRTILHFPGEKAEGMAPGMLGPVHGRVGTHGQSFVGRSVGGIHGDSQRRGDGQLVLLDAVGLGQCFQQFFRNMGGTIHICARQYQDEFIATQAGNRILVTQG